jgi:DNA-binding CsgD family transcriptional regulator/G:T-mismatch repair DNA endonuclease (very short patch repair protein)
VVFIKFQGVRRSERGGLVSKTFAKYPMLLLQLLEARDPKPTTTYQQVMQIKSLHDSKTSAKEIANITKLHLMTVQGVLRNLPTILKISSLYNNGVTSHKDIASALDLSRTDVTNIIFRYLTDFSQLKQLSKVNLNAEVKKRYLSGDSYTKIANDLNLKPAKVGYILRTEIPNFSLEKENARQQLVDEIERRLKQGQDRQTIASDLKIKPKSLQNIIVTRLRQYLTNIPSKVIADVGKEFAVGKDQNQIAASMGLSLGTVKYIINQYHTDLVNAQQQARDELKKKVAQGYTSGKSYEEIASELGISSDAASAIMRRHFSNLIKDRKNSYQAWLPEAKKLRMQGKPWDYIRTTLNIDAAWVTVMKKVQAAPEYKTVIEPAFIENRQFLAGTSGEEIAFFEVLSQNGVAFPPNKRNIRKSLGKYARYNLDAVDEDKKVVIEYFGDRWHANPRLPQFANNPDEPSNALYNLAPRAVWEHDKAKLDWLVNQGYKVIVVWGIDWKKKSVQNNIVDTIKMILDAKPGSALSKWKGVADSANGFQTIHNL